MSSWPTRLPALPPSTTQSGSARSVAPAGTRASASAPRPVLEIREFFPDTGETVSSAPFVRTNAPL